MEAAGDVGGELGAGDDFSQEEAGAMAGYDELAVEADEAQAGLQPSRDCHIRGSIP